MILINGLVMLYKKSLYVELMQRLKEPTDPSHSSLNGVSQIFCSHTSKEHHFFKFSLTNA